MTNSGTDATAIACDIFALSESERGAHFALAENLFTKAIQETHELSDGYAFRFAADEYARVTAFVANERRCCPFLTFTIEVPPHQSALWLRLTGTQPIKAFIKSEFKL